MYYPHDPFLTGAERRTKEAQFQKGSRETNMPTTFDGTLLDHLAEHMLYTSPLPLPNGLVWISDMTMVATYPNE